MADFCSLCGYGDINITELYNKHIKPTLAEDIKTLTDTQYTTVGVGGVCEHCGIVSIGVNNKFEAWGGYYGEEPHKFGHVDKETLELIINEDDTKYQEQRHKAKFEMAIFKFESAVLDLYCLQNKINKSKLKEQDLNVLHEIHLHVVNKLLKEN